MPFTPVSIRFSEECWAFLQGIWSDAPSNLRDDLRGLFERAPWVLVALPDPARTFVLHMLRLHAWELMVYLGATCRALAADDPLRRRCEECLEAVEEAIRRPADA